MLDAAPVQIREVMGGGVCLAGASEREVNSKADMAATLEQGSLLRATASTGMNKRSSRSHAIFTITVEQRRQVPNSSTANSEAGRGLVAHSSFRSCAKQPEGNAAGLSRPVLCSGVGCFMLLAAAAVAKSSAGFAS